MKHPLQRFLAVGVLLFAADCGWASVTRPGSPDAPPVTHSWSDDDVLVREALSRDYHRTDPVVRRRLARNLRFALAAEEARSDADLVDEAIALGMHRSDPLVRRRLIQKLRLRSQEQVREVEPSDSELRSFYDRHPERFEADERLQLAQVFFLDEREAVRYEPSSAFPSAASGDSFPLPHALPSLSRRELAQRFGSEFARSAFEAPLGRWTGPVRSSFGYHWVRVQERSPARAAWVESVRAAVREAVLRERSERRLRRLVETLRTRFDADELS